MALAFPWQARTWRLIFFFFFLSGDHLVPSVPLFRQGSVHSGSASWDDCGRAFPDELPVSSFPWTLFSIEFHDSHILVFRPLSYFYEWCWRLFLLSSASRNEPVSRLLLYNTAFWNTTTPPWIRSRRTKPFRSQTKNLRGDTRVIRVKKLNAGLWPSNYLSHRVTVWR